MKVQPPIAARAAGAPVYIVDASLNGVRLSHSALLAERTSCAISLEWHGTSIEFIELRWTNLQGEPFQSGFEIQAIDPASNAALHGLINECVGRMPLYFDGRPALAVVTYRLGP